MKEISPMALVAKRDYCYSGKFALKPGKQTLSLSYFHTAGLTSYSTLKPFEVQFYAEKGRLYRTFYVLRYELDTATMNSQNRDRFFVEIYDVTDREALSKVAKSGRFEAFRQEAKAMLQQLDTQMDTELPEE
jgi:hypothetical protein